MALTQIHILLIGSYEGERNVPAEEFLPPTTFQGEPVTVTSNAGIGRTATVDFAELRLDQFLNEDEPSEVFHRELMSIQENLSEWLDQQSPQDFATMLARGLEIALFFDLTIDDDQIGLDLIPALLRACGRLNIKIDINSY